jgi:hypothetical protein
MHTIESAVTRQGITHDTKLGKLNSQVKCTVGTGPNIITATILNTSINKVTMV